MDSSLFAAWLVGEGVAVWRITTRWHKPPAPAQLLGITGLFIGLALFADAVPNARRTVTLLAWGLDIAGVLSIWARGFGGQVTQAQTAEATAEGQPPAQVPQ